ncbi:MAG: hypothetical protein P4L74_06570 [Candidatus Doudnabacteria bacterium]|nr:hypothetical protein [Candidatus Doudnabacteria bacterium]
MPMHGGFIPKEASEEQQNGMVMIDQIHFLIEHYEKCNRKGSPDCDACQRYLKVQTELLRPFAMGRGA